MSRGGARGNAGRRRKAPELKALAGTLRADRDGAAEVAFPGDMVPPAELGEQELRYFTRLATVLAEQKRASPHFVQHLALVATRLAQIERWQAVLECSGDTYESNTAHGTIIRKRPEVAMLSDAMRQAQSLLGELLLNPSAALRLADGKKPEEDDFAEFFN